MNADNNNKNSVVRVEKFKGSFSDVKGGVTVVINNSINQITDVHALAVYSYLLTKPAHWSLSQQDISKHFKLTKNRTYATIKYLMANKFITRTQVRQKGKFDKYEYKVYLNPQDENRPNDDSTVSLNPPLGQIQEPVIDQIIIGKPFVDADISPNINSPIPDLRDTAESDTYKTKIIKNKDNKKINIVDFNKSTEDEKMGTKNLPAYEKPGSVVVKEKRVSAKKERPPEDYKANELFMLFYALYPLKEKPRVAYKTFLKLNPNKDFVEMINKDVQARLANNWKFRSKSGIPHPSSYLSERQWEGEIYEPECKLSYGTKKNEGIVNVGHGFEMNGKFIR